MRLMATTYAAPYAAPTLTPTDAVAAERLRQLQDEGFCIVPDMAPRSLIEHTRACAERASPRRTKHAWRAPGRPAR